MNPHEIDRIAAAINCLRPDWPVASLRTLLAGPKLAHRPRRDVAVALVWVACESASKTPARVNEHGPWWLAAAVEAEATGHQHTTTVYGPTEGDPREVCAECSLHRSECERRAATNGHTFIARTAVKWTHKAPDLETTTREHGDLSNEESK